MIFTILLAIANRTLKPNPDKSARNMADKPEKLKVILDKAFEAITAVSGIMETFIAVFLYKIDRIPQL